MALVWNPGPETMSDAAIVARVEAMVFEGMRPFDDASVDLLGLISKEILASPVGRTQPQYVALGYWLRAAALKRLCGQLIRASASENCVLAPRGVALHLPPTNVDTIFVYSWAVSVLAGNCNIVRLPTSLDSNTNWLAELITRAIATCGQSARHIFCQMPQDGQLVSDLSALCDLRMIWGGDAKVAAVSKTLIRPDGLSIGFPDRKSACVINAVAYADADNATRTGLAAQFFNDVYWFDQMGCGSPRVFYWVGDPGTLSEDFFRRLTDHGVQKGHATETGTAINKFAEANAMLAAGLAEQGRSYSNALHVVESTAPGRAAQSAIGGGFIVQTVIESIEQLARDVSRQTQTLTHFGFDHAELLTLAHAIVGRGGYRIVPIGQALAFDVIWDGIDLAQHMTRKVVVAR